MFVFFFLVITFSILAICIYTVNLSKEGSESKTLACIGAILILATILISKINNEINKEDIVNILNGDVKYDTISMDKYGKLLEIEIIK